MICDVDLHCHVGGLSGGAVVKIPGDRGLTVAAAVTAATAAGIRVLAIVDAHIPGVQEELLVYETLPGGGLAGGGTRILLGSEVQVRVGERRVHLVVLYPDLQAARRMTVVMREMGVSVDLSTQLLPLSAAELAGVCRERGWLLIAAHVFTPHYGLLSAVDDVMRAGLGRGMLAAVEMGLSADAGMAGRLSCLDGVVLLACSDAHSRWAIGRECTRMELASDGYEGVVRALMEGKIVGYRGLPPQLGKYYESSCKRCRALVRDGVCKVCGGDRMVGVRERVEQIADKRPGQNICYEYQVPLQHVVGIGRRSRERLIDAFGSERAVWERAIEDVTEVVGSRVARIIGIIRRGDYRISPGGGGKFGRVITGDG